MASALRQTAIAAIGLCYSSLPPMKIQSTASNFFRCSTRRYTHSFLTFTPPYSLRNAPFPPTLNAQTVSTITETVEEVVKLQVPLFERPPIFSTCSEDLLKWRKWAQDLANSVGSKYLEADGGPDSEDLLREIEWLLEDAVDEYSPNLATFEAPITLNMRTSVEDLYSLWSDRVEKRRPFQYIVGCSHWRDVVLSVQEGVLIPRPVTEELIEIAQKAIATDGSLARGVWADLGTGSGALAIGLAQLLDPEGHVVAVDLSHVALSIARYNVQRYELQARVEVRQGSWFLPLQDVNGKLAGVLSNPPYIPEDQIPGLQAEVGKHEPRLALNGGQEGIEDLLHLCRGCISALRSGGFLGFETNGERQADALADLLSCKSDSSFRDVQIIADYAGIPRFVTAFRC